MARKPKIPDTSPYARTLRNAERSMIEFAAQQAGSLRGAASLLGVTPKFLIKRAQTLGVPAPPKEARAAPLQVLIARVRAREELLDKSKTEFLEEPPTPAVPVPAKVPKKTKRVRRKKEGTSPHTDVVPDNVVPFTVPSVEEPDDDPLSPLDVDLNDEDDEDVNGE